MPTTRKYNRRNAIHVLIPYSKPLVCQHGTTVREDPEEDWRTNIDAAYSPASIPKDQVLGYIEFNSCGYPSSIYMVPEDQSEDDDDDQNDKPQCHLRIGPSSLSSLLSSNKKIVRFDESRNQEYDNEQMSKESCKSLWYTIEENRQFRASRAAAINEIAVIDEMHRHRDLFSYRKVLQQTFEACSRVIHETEDGVLTGAEEDLLRQCLKLHICRLGMERTMAIRSIANEERFRYHELLNVVTQNSSHRDEFIRSVCEELSRPSRLFARHLAKAQAAGS